MNEDNRIEYPNFKARDHKYPMELGAIYGCPYDGHERGNNWLAVISKDPKAPGGLERKFLERARGKYRYMIDGLRVGDAVEFAADRRKYHGGTSRERHYGVITEITETEITFREVTSGNANHAFQLQEIIGADDVDRRLDALHNRKEALLAQIAQVDAEIKELESEKEAQ